MQQGRSSIPFLILLACAAAFIGVTSRCSLPAVVASHFNAAGVANGFMTRALYVPFTFAFAVVLPLLLVFLSSRALNNPKARINLPNHEYWLAPERRAETADFVRRHLARFASMLALLVCYVHWLVVRANALVPPSLSSFRFLGGLGVFLIFTGVWVMVFLGRFRKIAR